MANKQVRFFLIVKAQLCDRRFLTLFGVLCFGMGYWFPLLAYPSTKTSVVQSLPDAQQLEQQGKNLYAVERFSQAAAVFQQAAAAFQAQKDRPRQAMSLSNASLCYQQLGQWEQAKQAIASSLDLLEYSEQGRGGEGKNFQIQNPNSKIQNLKVLAQTLNVQGRLHLATGQAESALSAWQQADEIYTQIGDRLGSLRSRINWAQALQTLGLYTQAQKLLTEVNQNFQQLPDSKLKATELRSLGNTLRIAGDLKQSRQILQQSLVVARLQSSQASAETLLSLGNTALVQQDIPTALKYYQQAATTSTSPTTRIQAQLNQLRLLVNTKQLKAAQTLGLQIQPQIAELPSSRSTVYARINFAQSLIKLGIGGGETNDEVAIADSRSIAQILARSVQQAREIKDQRAEAYALGQLGELYERTGQWSEAKTLTEQALMLAQQVNATDIGYRWQWQLGRLLKSQGDTKGAIAAYTEAVKQLKSLRQDLVALNPDVQFNFRDEVEPVYRELVDLLLRSPADSQPSQQNLIQARAMIESLQLAELDNFLRLACLEGKPVQIDRVVDQEDITAAVIYPIILADRLAVILKLPGQPLRYYQTPVAQKDVEQLLENWRQQLVKPYTQRTTQTLSQQVYNWLIRPAVTDLASRKIKTLVFVLDGSLRNLPMAALYDGQQYLVQKYAIALTPGLQLLNPTSLKQQQVKVLTAGLTQARGGFDPLTYVGLELEQIKAEVPNQILLNQQFTSLNLQKQIKSVSFPVVHLATHGQFSSKVEQTFILAWDKQLNVNDLNTILQTRNPIHNYPIELLVLSACQTAEGDRRAALGLAGVAMRAGARSTVASLWNVDDESTALMMAQFYQKLGNSQINKAEALRQAQLSLLKNPKYQVPMFWASYVIVGNWL